MSVILSALLCWHSFFSLLLLSCLLLSFVYMLFVYSSIYLLICLFICCIIFVFVFQFSLPCTVYVSLSLCTCKCFIMHLSVLLSVYVSVPQSACLFVHFIFCLPVSLSVHMHWLFLCSVVWVAISFIVRLFACLFLSSVCVWVAVVKAAVIVHWQVCDWIPAVSEVSLLCALITHQSACVCVCVCVCVCKERGEWGGEG